MEIKKLFDKDERGLSLAALLTWSVIAGYDILNPPFSTAIPVVLSLYIAFLIFVILSNPVVYTFSSGLKKKKLILGAIICVFILIAINRGASSNHILLILVAVSLPGFLSELEGIIIIALNALILSAILLYFLEPFEALATLAYNSGFVIFAFQNSTQRMRMKTVQSQLEKQNQELLKTRDLLARNAKNEERLRISRDLHDILGHQLTALNLNLETVYQKTPLGNRPYLETCRRLSKELLQDVRGVVRLMRDETIYDFYAALVAIGNHFPNLSVKIDMPDQLTLSNSRLTECLLRCCQEAITNAVRHGKADRIHIGLSRQSDRLSLMLEDNGSANGVDLSGAGLIGMKERLSQFRGSLSTFEKENSGWIVEISIPENEL